MKLSYAIILIALLTGQSASLAFASTSVNGICQFDKSTMIKEKLKKAQECINNGNYSGAKNYLNGVLKLDPNNAKAKELLAICNNGGKPVSSPRDNSSSSNSNNDTQTGTIYKSTPYLNVSKNEMFFASDGGYESISISSNNTWKIKLNTVLKKAQECINNGNYSGAKNYLNGVFRKLMQRMVCQCLEQRELI